MAVCGKATTGSVLSGQSRLTSIRWFLLHGWSAARALLAWGVAAKSGGGGAERNRGQAGTAARLSPVGMEGRGVSGVPSAIRRHLRRQIRRCHSFQIYDTYE